MPLDNKDKKVEKKSRETVARSITFSTDTDNMIDKMSLLPKYRNNRSFVIESLIVDSPEYIAFVDRERRGLNTIGHTLAKNKIKGRQ